MDFFDDVLGRIIPALIIFMIFRNILTVIFGSKRDNEETEDVPSEYDENGNPVETETIENEEDPVEAERRKILEEFERMMKLPKEPLPYDEELSKKEPQKTEQKIIHDGEVTTIHKDDETLAHDNKGVIHRDGEAVEHDNKGVIIRDAKNFEHDNSKIYTEKPLIEEERVEHINVDDNRKAQPKRPHRPQLVNVVKWMEILGKPKGF